MKKNKHNSLGKFLTILVICLGLIFTFTYSYKVKADSGFDSSWDSGGSFDSDSSYGDYDSSYGSGGSGNASLDPESTFFGIYIFASLGVYYLVSHLIYPNRHLSKVPFLYTSFCIILNGFITYILFDSNYAYIITFSTFIVTISNRVRGFLNRIFSGQLLSENNNNIDYKKLENKDIVELLPNLDINNFYKETFNIYKEVQIAWMDNDIERVRSMLSDYMFNTYKMQLETLKVKNQKNMMEDIELRDVYIININKENNKEVIDVIMNVSCKDYLIDINSNEVLRGNKNKVWHYEYKLSYMRTNGEKIINHCPNCGSKLEDGSSIKCNYCGSIINRSTDKFILIDKKNVESKVVMKMNDSELISKFSNIYIMLLYSVMTNDVKRVKHFISDELYNKYENIVDNHINNNETQMYDELNVYKINVESKEIVNNRETIKIKLISRYMDYIVDNKTKKIKAGVNTCRIEKTNYLVFERNINGLNNDLVYTCPNCGANLDINYNGICSYCKQSINLKDEDYILTSIEII